MTLGVRLSLFFLTALLAQSCMTLAQTRKQDHYKVLGVSRDATKEEITRSFKKLALQWYIGGWNVQALTNLGTLTRTAGTPRPKRNTYKYPTRMKS